MLDFFTPAAIKIFIIISTAAISPFSTTLCAFFLVALLLADLHVVVGVVVVEVSRILLR